MKNFVLKLVRVFYKLLFRIEIEGMEKIPTDRNFIVAPNHLSNFDPPLIAAFLNIDNMSYMAKESLFKVPVVAQVIKAFNAFPVKASDKLSCIKIAIRILKDGGCLAIFPEGKRVRTPGVLGEGKKGTIMIATKANVGVLPVGIEATYKIGSKVKVTIGDFIDLSDYYGQKLSNEEIQNLTREKLMPKIAELAGAKTYGN